MVDRLNGYGAQETSDRYIAQTPFLETGAFAGEDGGEVPQEQFSQAPSIGALELQTPFLPAAAGEFTGENFKGPHPR